MRVSFIILLFPDLFSLLVNVISEGARDKKARTERRTKKKSQNVHDDADEDDDDAFEELRRLSTSASTVEGCRAAAAARR